jgi:pteridine reductase
MTDKRKVALVTGGAKRVGRAIVERLAAGGFDGVFTYLSSEAEARDLQGSLAARGATFVSVRADLTHPEAACEAITSAVAASFDRLDVLVNSASLYQKATLEDTTLEMTRRLWAIHAESPILLCQKFASLLRKSRGSVINMVDLLAEKPWPQYLAYCASKAALWNLTLSLARSLAPEVTVNAIAPGVVEWPPGYPEAEREKYLKRVPLGRAGTPADVADAIHFLCTTGRYITGQIIHLDGGRSIT